MLDSDSDKEQNNKVSSDLREQTKVFNFYICRILKQPNINHSQNSTSNKIFC